MISSKEEWIKALNDRHGIEFQNKISSTTVAVCGLGGLGSNIAFTLARAGIGKLILIDFDSVDVTNLHRQQYKAYSLARSRINFLLSPRNTGSHRKIQDTKRSLNIRP